MTKKLLLMTVVLTILQVKNTIEAQGQHQPKKLVVLSTEAVRKGIFGHPVDDFAQTLHDFLQQNNVDAIQNLLFKIPVEAYGAIGQSYFLKFASPLLNDLLPFILGKQLNLTIGGDIPSPLIGTRLAQDFGNFPLSLDSFAIPAFDLLHLAVFPLPLAELQKTGRYERLLSGNLSYQNITDIEGVAWPKDLISLVFRGNLITTISDETIALLASLPNLQEINLANNPLDQDTKQRLRGTFGDKVSFDE